MTRLHWVRHGPTHAKTFVGWRDVPADLSDQPKIARLNAFLPQKAAIVSSDLLRCVTTADALAQGRTRLPPQAGLREFHFGVWDGQRFDDVAAQDPKDSRRYWETPGEVAPIGGESWLESAKRVSHAADNLIRLGFSDIVIVAHFGAILTQVQRALGCSASDVLSHKIDNLSVTEIQIADNTRQAVRINHVP